MTEQAIPRFPQNIVRQLKDAGFMDRVSPSASPSTEAVMRCARCPLASDAPFFASRAIKCASLPAGSVFSIVHRLENRNFLEGISSEKNDPKKIGRPRILYKVSAKAKSILRGAKPLPNCQYRNRQQTEDTELVSPESVSLADLRKMTGATQGEVCARLGINQSAVSEVENGALDDMSIGRVDRYLKSLGGRLIVIAEFGNQRFEVSRKKPPIRKNRN